ncbi:flavodoxin family protein [Massilia cellulosiltytica]|uniref:flavodoxin family protein n=1 Tax=Massilia cellulosiltytica TaxID=2683234 RepID=UPI0039B51676
MKTCLVVYYSRTGITQEVAQRIAAECACDIEPIRDMRSRRGVAGYVRCCHEAFSHKTPAIAPMSRHPGDYELVILGAPVWVGRLSAPMRITCMRTRDGCRAWPPSARWADRAATGRSTTSPHCAAGPCAHAWR